MNGPRTSIKHRIWHVPRGWWILIFAVASLAICALPLVDSLRFVAAANHTTGVIVEVVPVNRKYQPIVQYTSADGRQLQIASRETAGDRSYYQVGDTIGVLYAPGNPADARLDTWQSRWASDAIMPALGVFVLVLGLLHVRQSRRHQLPYRHQRHFAASPAQTYAAMTIAVTRRFRQHDSDQTAMRMRFQTGTNVFTWGETFTAPVTPTPSGATVSVTGAGKIPTVLWQTWRLNTLTQRLLADIAAQLGPTTTQAIPDFTQPNGPDSP